MPRYKITLEYDGTFYLGWQTQRAGRTVQQALTEAFHKFSGQNVQIFGSGRTDAGVHALGQVAHVDLDKAWPTQTIRKAANAWLRAQEDDVVLVRVEEVDDAFDARFSAKKRFYAYRVLNREASSPTRRFYTFHVFSELNVLKMALAAKTLLGQHDFTTFRTTRCQAKSPIKTLDSLEVQRIDDEVRIEAASRSFLHTQVRSMAGALIEVGLGRWTKEDLKAALEKQDRACCAPVAPARGLFFLKTEY